jgi:hypothetical protein
MITDIISRGTRVITDNTRLNGSSRRRFCIDNATPRRFLLFEQVVKVADNASHKINPQVEESLIRRKSSGAPELSINFRRAN